MRKVLDFVNANKKIIVVVLLIAVLAAAAYFLGGRQKESQAAYVDSSEKSPIEIKLTGILSSIEGVGAANVMINEGKDGILGVVIVCEGADSLMTRSDILNAVSTALKIDKKIIAIYSMNN